MKKIDVGQTVQILANVGVIAGILFLAMELRQNNALLELQTHYNRKQTRSDWYQLLGTDERAVEVILKARNPETLTEIERVQLSNLNLALLTNFEWDVYEYRNNRIEIPTDAWRRVFAGYPGLRETFESQRDVFSADFARFIDENVLTER
jgi:hypothetical protein